MIYLLNTVLISLFSNHITSMGYGWNILDIKMPWDLRRAYEGPWFLPTTTSEDQWMRKQETNLDVGSMKLGLALDLVLFFSLFFFFFLPPPAKCVHRRCGKILGKRKESRKDLESRQGTSWKESIGWCQIPRTWPQQGLSRNLSHVWKLMEPSEYQISTEPTLNFYPLFLPIQRHLNTWPPIMDSN